MSELTLETKYQENKTLLLGAAAMMNPSLGGDYWAYRVKVCDTQAIVGFPKFATIGIGYAVEYGSRDTNLPYTCDTGEILKHISCNKGDASISDEDCLTAIAMIQEAVVKEFTPHLVGIERLAYRVSIQPREPGSDNSAYLLAESVRALLRAAREEATR